MGDSTLPVGHFAPNAASMLQATTRQAQVSGGANNYAGQANLQARDQTERAVRAGPAARKASLMPGAIFALDPASSAGATHHDEEEHADGRGSKRQKKKKNAVPTLPAEIDELE